MNFHTIQRAKSHDDDRPEDCRDLSSFLKLQSEAPWKINCIYINVTSSSSSHINVHITYYILYVLFVFAIIPIVSFRRESCSLSLF